MTNQGDTKKIAGEGGRKAGKAEAEVGIGIKGAMNRRGWAGLLRRIRKFSRGIFSRGMVSSSRFLEGIPNWSLKSMNMDSIL